MTKVELDLEKILNAYSRIEVKESNDSSTLSNMSTRVLKDRVTFSTENSNNATNSYAWRKTTAFKVGNKAENTLLTLNVVLIANEDGTKTWTDTFESRFEVPKENNLSNYANNSSAMNAPLHASNNNT